MRLLEAARWLIRDICQVPWSFLVNVVGGSTCTPRVLRWLCYRAGGLSVSTPSVLHKCYFISKRVEIGKKSFINFGCRFVGEEKVSLGTRCSVGFETAFVTSSHSIGPSGQRCGSLVTDDIVVEDGDWIGARCIVLPGVRIACGCVIAAGAVVTRSCESNGVYGGLPAKRLRDLEDSAVTLGPSPDLESTSAGANAR